MYGTQTLITISPDQLGELLRGVIRSELASYSPPLPDGSDLPELLTRQQVAERLQVSLVTLNDWAKDTPDRSAILVPHKVGTRVRYRREDVLTVSKEQRRFKDSKV